MICYGYIKDVLDNIQYFDIPEVEKIKQDMENEAKEKNDSENEKQRLFLNSPLSSAKTKGRGTKRTLSSSTVDNVGSSSINSVNIDVDELPSKARKKEKKEKLKY